MLSELYRQHIGDVRRFLARKLKSAEEAADAAQDVFVQILSGNAIASLQNPKGYVFRAAKNRAIDAFRTAKARPECVNLETQVDDVAGDAPEPDRMADLRQQLRTLEAAIGELPSKCRRVFVLHRFTGLTQAQIATELGISRQAVEKHIVRALTILRARMPE